MKRDEAVHPQEGRSLVEVAAAAVVVAVVIIAPQHPLMFHL
jgi:preprotein translocase subunit SecF